MSALGRAFLAFPPLVLLCALASAGTLVFRPSWAAAGALLFSLYGLPLCAFHLLSLLFPVREGLSDFSGRAFSPWWAAHQIQAIYIAFPALEAALRLVPGVFSFWLRLWGSRIGRNVHWSPRVDVLDRNLLEIGDRVVFGHKVICFGHVIKAKGGRLVLFVRRVRIGSGAFIGAGCRLGPGAVVPPAAVVPLLSDLYVNERFDPVAEPEPVGHG